jgi:Na+/H+-translocating membrane pyrophosphatase
MVLAGESSSARSRAFVIHPAVLAGMALFGGYLFNINLHTIDSEDAISITEPLIFTGILLGAMVPFLISGIVLPSVQKTSA